MVYRMPVKAVSSLPLPIHKYQPKPFFSLFKKVDGSWKQARTNVYSAEMACKVWGEIILKNPYSFTIRPATPESTRAK
jgi:hypothetical protein